MKGKKELLADILFNSKVVNLFKRLPMRNKLIVLNYHRIRPSNPQFQTAFDEGYIVWTKMNLPDKSNG